MKGNALARRLSAVSQGLDGQLGPPNGRPQVKALLLQPGQRGLAVQRVAAIAVAAEIIADQAVPLAAYSAKRSASLSNVPKSMSPLARKRIISSTPHSAYRSAVR